MANYSTSIEDFLTFLRTCEQSYHMAEADEQEADSITQDLLHSIEVRKLRRTAKDTMGQTAPILDWIEQNRSVVKGLEQLLGAVRKAERSAENRIYTPRVKKREGEQKK